MKIGDKITSRDPVLVITSYSRLLGVGILLFFLLFIAGGAWAYFAKLSGAVIVQGQVAVLGKPKTIQHIDGGIVSEIAIDNYEFVSKGDVLIRLDDKLLGANLNIYQNRLRESVAQRARLIAERDLTSNINWEGITLKLFNIDMSAIVRSRQQKLFEVGQAVRHGQTEQLREKIKQFRNQMLGIEAVNASRIIQSEFLIEELKGIRLLNKKGLTPKSQLMSLERQRQTILGQLAHGKAEYSRILNSISETEIQIIQISREFRQSVLTELRQIDQEINDMMQQLYATVEKQKRTEIRAPISGIIHELAVFTIGGVIGPGNPVLQIIPQNSGFEIEANIAPQFVDEIYSGQSAKLRFSAFNQRQTPELDGTVKKISPNVIISKQTGMPYYKIRLTVLATELVRLKKLIIVPGMPVEIYFKTRERTALNYFLKPLLDQMNRTFKEQ